MTDEKKADLADFLGENGLRLNRAQVKAMKAFEHMQVPTTANVFDVYDEDGESCRIDLLVDGTDPILNAISTYDENTAEIEIEEPPDNDDGGVADIERLNDERTAREDSL